MSNRPSVAAGCSPSGVLTTTPHSAGFFEPLNPHDNSHNYPGLRVQDSSGYAWPSSTAAQPISPVTLSDLHRQRPMMTYFGEVGTGLIRDPLITTPETPRQSPGYMLPNSDVDTRLHNLGGMGYPTLLSNGPIKTPTGTQCGPRCAHQPVTGLVRSESGNPPLQDSSPQLSYLQCGWIGCTNQKPFAREGDLVRHLKTQHISRGAWYCEICSRVFNRSDNLDSHIQRCHRHE